MVRALWMRGAARYDGLSLRERVMVGAAAMVALLALAYTLLIEPEILRERRAAAALLQKQSEVKAFEAQVTKIIASRAADPDRADRERLVRLKEELAALDARIGAEEKRFTAPAQMRAVVQSLLGSNRGVALVELKTLPPTTISEAKEGAGAAPPASKAAAGSAAERLIYRHGLEVTVAGSYLDLLAYLRDLERLPTQLYWGGLELDAAAYPRVSMKLTVYTLSLDRAWLSV